MVSEKGEIIKKFRTSEEDTGSPCVQIAIFTQRINNLTRHLQEFKKDFSSRLGLLKIIGKRRSLLNYLKKRNEQEYQSLVKTLNIRR